MLGQTPEGGDGTHTRSVNIPHVLYIGGTYRYMHTCVCVTHHQGWDQILVVKLLLRSHLRPGMHKRYQVLTGLTSGLDPSNT